MLQPGDLVQIKRDGGDTHTHWGVYAGDGQSIHLLIHFTVDEGVRKDTFSDVVGKSRFWALNHSKDKDYTPRPTAEYLKIAEGLVGSDKLKNLKSSSAEDFVLYLRYCKGSEEMKKAIEEITNGANRHKCISAMLQPGDLVEIKRDGGVNHWGVYAEDDYLIHFTVDEGVRKDKCDDVVGKSCSWGKNHSKDSDYTPRPNAEYLKEAEGLVGSDKVKNLKSASTEDFVFYLRYGKGSEEMKKAIEEKTNGGLGYWFISGPEDISTPGRSSVMSPGDISKAISSSAMSPADISQGIYKASSGSATNPADISKPSQKASSGSAASSADVYVCTEDRACHPV